MTDVDNRINPRSTKASRAAAAAARKSAVVNEANYLQILGTSTVIDSRNYRWDEDYPAV